MCIVGKKNTRCRDGVKGPRSQALEKSEGAPGTHRLHMHGSLGFSRELGNYCICLHLEQSYIAGSLELSHVMVVSSGKEVALTKPPSVRSESQEWC